MYLGYELSNGSTVHAIALYTVYYKSGAKFAVTALSWSFLYIVQETLLLENLLVITEWISSQTTLTSSLESLWAIASISNQSIDWSSLEEDHFYPLLLY